MSYELFISLRYLKAKRKQAFISLISLISIGGVAVGVAALIIVLAVMTGVKEDVRDRILDIMAHILIQPPTGKIVPEDAQAIAQQLDDVPQIAESSPYVSGQILVSSADSVSGIKLLGIDPDKTIAFANLEKIMQDGHVTLLKGKYESLEHDKKTLRDGIIIGLELARILGVFTDDEITLILPEGRYLPIGVFPKIKKYRVVGIFSSGFYEYDVGLAYISLTSAQKFFNVGTAVSGVEVRLNDIYQSVAVAKTLKQRLGASYIVQDWTDLNKSLFSALNLEKLAMFLILALIILVAAFNIISTLVMMVIEKNVDIATLKSMGATPESIMKIFMFEGSVIGVIGTVIGTGLGIVVCWVADTWELISLGGGPYYLDHLPFSIAWLDVVLVVVAALVICFVSTIYPARQASKLDPIVVFRYE